MTEASEGPCPPGPPEQKIGASGARRAASRPYRVRLCRLGLGAPSGRTAAPNMTMAEGMAAVCRRSANDASPGNREPSMPQACFTFGEGPRSLYTLA